MKKMFYKKNLLNQYLLYNIGDNVNAFATVGSVTVTFRVTARANGGFGDNIRVIRNNDKENFRAEVIDSKTVKIIE